VARLLKDQLRQEWRQTMKRVKLPSEEPYRRTSLALLNSVFVTNRTKFWSKVRNHKPVLCFVISFTFCGLLLGYQSAIGGEVCSWLEQKGEEEEF